MQPGDALGIISAQDLMRRATQSNLSSFHEAGLRSTNSSIPIQDMLDMTDKNSSMLIETSNHKSFRGEYLSRKFEYYVLSYKTSLYVDEDTDSFWRMANSNILVRFYTNYKKLVEDCRTLEFIREMIMSRKDYNVDVSSDFVGILDITERYSINESIHKKIIDILSINLGIDGITEYNDGVTVGSNLSMVSRLECVNGRTLSSNSVKQVEEVFGIEAARGVVYERIKDTCDEPDVIADYMTFNGRLHAFNKFSPDHNDKGIISSMGFERPSTDIRRLSSGESKDDGNSVYSRIALGKRPYVGSNSKIFTIF
jgi:DNA-directed RNA polymerase subunit A"